MKEDWDLNLQKRNYLRKIKISRTCHGEYYGELMASASRINGTGHAMASNGCAMAS
jgi:hypothetical protein